MRKYLIVRFSSFGDIAQALPCARVLRRNDPQGEIHFVTRADFRDFVKSHPAVDQVWALDRETGLKGLLRLTRQLNREGITHIYDAHNNLRSWILTTLLLLKKPERKVLRRSKNRLRRWLLFRWRWNTFAKPFRGGLSFFSPLKKWFPLAEWPIPECLLSSSGKIPDGIPYDRAMVFAPSANWELKRWPVANWRRLAEILPCPVILLGGPDDTFCEEIRAAAPERIYNLAGKLSWTESAEVVQRGRAVISGDTGILHVADLMGRPVLAIMGPTAFGFPSQPTSQVLERDLSCRPCTKDGRGRCHNKEFKKCLVDITPESVFERIKAWV